ncbi:MAG: hypothetical protein MJ212_03870 [Alphaproteobacteria bacterium]|nr:hypothetical protein [Alphaproteobacteria bacterium]
MKKFISLLIVSVLFCNTAHADRVIILDENNNVKQEIYTQPMSGTQQAYIQPTPQQVIVQQPAQEVVVVRPRPIARSYSYDSTETALFAGFTGAVIGNAIFRGGHHHHHGHFHGGPHHRRH